MFKFLCTLFFSYSVCLGSDDIVMKEEAPLSTGYEQKVHLCLLQLDQENRFFKPTIGLMDKGAGLGLPVIDVPDHQTDLSVAENTLERWGLKNQSIHSLMEVETPAIDGGIIAHTIMVVLLKTTDSIGSFRFEQLGNSALFYPKYHQASENNMSKPLEDFNQLYELQKLLYDGIDGDRTQQLKKYPSKDFKTLLSTFGNGSEGHLTIAPALFEIYAQGRIKSEVHHKCIIL